MELKIFRVENLTEEEIETIAAYSSEQALELSEIYDVYANQSVQVTETPKEEWSEYEIVNTEFDPTNPDFAWEFMTFEECMKDTKTPQIIASTLHD